VEVEALCFIMEARSGGTFRGSWGFYFIKTTRNRERLGDVGALQFIMATRSSGTFRGSSGFACYNGDTKQWNI